MRILSVRGLREALVVIFVLTASGTASAQEPAALVNNLAKADMVEIFSISDSLVEKGDDAVEALRGGMESQSENVRFGCARALLLQGEEDDSVEPLLLLLEKARSEEVKRRAIELLVSEEIIEAGQPMWNLVNKVMAPETKVRLLWGVWQLSPTNRRAVSKKLKGMLRSDNKDIKYEAALALADISDFESAMPTLEEMASEPTDRGRMAGVFIRMSYWTKYVERSIQDDVRRSRRSAESGRAGENLVDEVIGMLSNVHHETYRQGWARKELRSYLEEQAVRGMLSSLDIHSALLTADELEAWKYGLNPSYSGIGSYVAMDDESRLLILTQPMFGGPAYRAGVEPGDRVITVDGWDAKNRTVDQVTSRLKGPRGSYVEVEMHRKGWEKTRKFKILRERIKIPTVIHGMLPGNVGYCALITFGGETANELESALLELEGAGMKALILDLRNNGGGYLAAARKIAGKFLKGRKLVCYWEGRPGIQRRVDELSSPSGRTWSLPLTVLTNEYSASASEIVSGALKEHGRAMLIGARTFGKGSVQRVLDITSRKDEPYTDEARRNGKRDRGESFEDGNGNGRYDDGEKFEDRPRPDGIWNKAEAFTDANENGAFDAGEEYVDLNGDGEWNPAEKYEDLNKNGRYDPSPKIKLTIARYYLPSGKSIHTERRKDGTIISKGGVEPDIAIEQTRLQGWKVEEIERILESKALDNYIQERLVPDKELFKSLTVADNRKTDAYPGFDELYESLETPLPKNDVRIYLRLRLRRVAANHSGRPMIRDFQEDRQLQRAIFESLKRTGTDIGKLGAYEIFANDVPQPKPADADEAEKK